MQKNKNEQWQYGLNVDFSQECKNKNAIKDDLLTYLESQNKRMENITGSIDEKEIITMKKNKNFFSKFKALPLVIVLGVLAISATAFGIYNYLSLGKHAQYQVTNEEEAKQFAQAAKTPIEKDLSGKLFDKNGNEAKTYEDIVDGAYNIKGEEVTLSMSEDGAIKIQTAKDIIEEKNGYTSKYTSEEEAKTHTVFDFNTPSYIPNGYSLDVYRIYKNDDGSASSDSKYIEMSMIKDDDISKQVYIQVRFMDEETAFATGSANMDKTVINGHQAIVTENTIDMLVGDVMYMIASSSSKLPIEEIIKIAESI